jgi:16S rRNA G966 N2-methylase RsmD
MFNKNFYPTPIELANKMAAGIKFSGKYVLEPSAGKGDLAKVTYGAKGVHLIESEPELCAILEKYCDQTYSNREKKAGWKIVAYDFLSFVPSCDYDVIIMNPPFDAGAAHFMHAWNIADGCEIRCLLNAETLRNPHTQERENLAQIISQFGGKIEFISDAFGRAERRTSVEVALVSIYKPAKQKLDLSRLFSGEKIKVDGVGDDMQHTELATPSYIKNSVACFNQAKDALKDVFKALAKFNYYAEGCGANSKHNFDKNHKQLFEYIQNGKQEDYNAAVEEMTANAWGDFFRRPAYQKMITSGFKDAFEKEQVRRGAMAFSEANLNSLLETLIGTRGRVMQKAVTDSFDFLTSYDKKNIIHKEGWKTNSHYKVNMKCIVPALHEFNSKWNKTSFDYFHSQKTVGIFDDLDRALCFITGARFDKMQNKSIYHTVRRVIDEESEIQRGRMPAQEKSIYERQHESHFFFLRIYKKGTMHLTFKDDAHWAMFNQAAAKGKKWIG